MIKLYINLFSISYDSLVSYYNDIKIPELWNNQRKIQNKKVNKLVFEYIKKTSSKHKKLPDQFLLDMVNFYFYSSFKLRKWYLFNNNLFKPSKTIFIILSLMSTFFLAIKYLLTNSYIFFFKRIIFPKNISKEKVALIIGFPEHSFSINNQSLRYNCSLIEYLLDKNIIDNETEILSFEEYSLKKLKNNDLRNNLLKAKQQKRVVLKKSFSLNISPHELIRILINFLSIIKEYRFKPFSFYSYYLTRVLKAHEINNIIKIIEKKYKVADFIFISTYDMGNMKYSNNSNIYQFNYSRNNIYPFSKKAILNEFNKSFDLTIDEILEEIELDNFTLVYPNSIGHSYHAFFYSKLRQKINNAFKLNLSNNLNEPPKSESFSNFGYAFEEKIKLDTSKINIIVYDVANESKLENISRRGVHGMYSQLDDFKEIFLKEIINIFKRNIFALHYKGKYSNSNKHKVLIQEIANEFKIKVNIINEYSKIDFIDKSKFDFAISQPFTSSLFNLRPLANNSIYYIPNKFLDSFPSGIANTCYGSNVLTKKINKYEKNRR